MKQNTNQRLQRRQHNQFFAQSTHSQTQVLLSPDYWTNMGLTVSVFPSFLLIILSPTSSIEDHGNRLVLNCPGEPSDEAIRIMVEAGKAKGWKEIRFSGGSPEFQNRARLEALRQGYSFDQITLECEENQPKPALSMPMPEHIRRRIQPQSPEPGPILPSIPEPTSPSQEFRP